jgi:hypothetical protein
LLTGWGTWKGPRVGLPGGVVESGTLVEGLSVAMTDPCSELDGKLAGEVRVGIMGRGGASERER